MVKRKSEGRVIEKGSSWVPQKKKKSDQMIQGKYALERMKKRDMIRNATKVDGARDRISDLPEEIKSVILSLLPARDAMRTSLLSKQWRHKWTDLRILDLDDIQTMEKHRRIDCFQGNGPFPPSIDNCSLVQWVDQALKLLKSRDGGSCLDIFRVRLDIGQNSTYNKINKWVKTALERRVKVLDLDLTRCNVWEYRSPTTARYALSHSIISRHINTTSSNSLSLRVLRLRSVNVTGKTLECLILNSENLEELSIAASNRLTRLTVCSARLRKLEVIFCQKLNYLEIKAQNLTCFTLLKSRTCPQNVTFSSVPSLDDLCLTSGEHCANAISYLSSPSFLSVLLQVQKLTVEAYQRQQYFGAPVLFSSIELPVLSSLKQLCLRVNFFRMSSKPFPKKYHKLLAACPFLQQFRLEISVGNPERPYLPTLRQLFSHRKSQVKPVMMFEHLEVISIIGWIGTRCDSEFIIDLVGLTKNLKKIVFDARDPSTLASCPYDYISWSRVAKKPDLVRSLEQAKLIAEKLLPSPCAEVEFLPNGLI